MVFCAKMDCTTSRLQLQHAALKTFLRCAKICKETRKYTGTGIKSDSQEVLAWFSKTGRVKSLRKGLER